MTSLGAAAIALWRTIVGTLALGAASAASLGKLEWRLATRQAYELANRAVFFIFVVMSFVGAIMVLQAAAQAQRIVGDLSAIGPAFLQLVVREFGPTIVSLMVAARYGAGVAAELGAMTITEQVDALRMTGATPAGYLVAPRVVGGLAGNVPIVVFGTAVAFVAGGIAGRWAFGIGWETFFSTRLTSLSDVIVGLAKTAAYGVAVPLVACQAGLVARGGAPGVGRATTHAVIGASTAVLFLDLVIGTLGYLIEGASR
jgi:phospholipid/cholesterol/gamma-HCH transport system permease protein